jgi:hypothetical protein
MLEYLSLFIMAIMFDIETMGLNPYTCKVVLIKLKINEKIKH